MIWEDVTSYSSGERGTVPPKTWATRAAGMSIVVTRKHGVKNLWFLEAERLGGFIYRRLYATELADAQAEAINTIVERLKLALAVMGVEADA